MKGEETIAEQQRKLLQEVTCTHRNQHMCMYACYQYNFKQCVCAHTETHTRAKIYTRTCAHTRSFVRLCLRAKKKKSLKLRSKSVSIL